MQTLVTNARITENINLNWKFLKEDEPSAWFKGFDDTAWRDVMLPHDWSVEYPFGKEHSSGTGYLPGGTAWYRKTFTISENCKDKRIYITFGGVYNNSQVWCNSNYIDKRPYGYSTFTYDITDFVVFGETNQISVRVDHKETADSRWFTGSGIYRDVSLTIKDNLHIAEYGVFVTTPKITPAKALVKINLDINNFYSDDSSVKIINSVYDTNNNLLSSVEDSAEISAHLVYCNCEIKVLAPRLWSPDNPYLYSLKTEIFKDGVLLDDCITVFGIREFYFDADNGFFLNGENMKLKGVCLHHDAGCLGAAVPKKVWARRLKKLKESGCNAIRTSHNPPDTHLLDLCDAMGFLVMDEAFDEWEGPKNKWWQGHNVYPPKTFGYYEDFPQWQERDIKEMVKRDRNHPSIIMWSIGNEVDYPNDPYCHPYFETATGNNDANKPEAERRYNPNRPHAKRLPVIAKRLVKFVKDCDTTRPVTAAVALPELSNLIGYSDELDIVGYNYKEHLYVDDHIKYPGRVLYGSENSTSAEAWFYVNNNDYICGQFLWTGIDYLGEAYGWPIRAAMPGILDLAGFEKPNYYHRKCMWDDQPTLFISAKTDDKSDSNGNRKWNPDHPHWNWNDGQKLNILCYSNCEEVELFLNEKSLGKKSLTDYTDYCFVWNTEYEKGSLKATGTTKTGELITAMLKTSEAPKKIVLTPDTSELTANGQDIAHIEAAIFDQNNILAYTANTQINFELEGDGEILGIENGCAHDLTPYTSNFRNAHNGKMIVYIRSGKSTGTIKLKAYSDKTESAEIEISVNC